MQASLFLNAQKSQPAGSQTGSRECWTLSSRSKRISRIRITSLFPLTAQSDSFSAHVRNIDTFSAWLARTRISANIVILSACAQAARRALSSCADSKTGPTLTPYVTFSVRVSLCALHFSFDTRLAELIKQSVRLVLCSCVQCWGFICEQDSWVRERVVRLSSFGRSSHFFTSILCLAGPCASRSLSLFVLIQLNCLFALLLHTLWVIYLGDFYNVGKCDALCFWANVKILKFVMISNFYITFNAFPFFRLNTN